MTEALGYLIGMPSEAWKRDRVPPQELQGIALGGNIRTTMVADQKVTAGNPVTHKVTIKLSRTVPPPPPPGGARETFHPHL